ncbi:hypothetical protein HGM15179_017399, partial [Zosterops borbonicus]
PRSCVSPACLRSASRVSPECPHRPWSPARTPQMSPNAPKCPQPMGEGRKAVEEGAWSLPSRRMRRGFPGDVTARSRRRSWGAMAPGRVRISFPRHAPTLLDSLNRLRLQGKFCDVAIHAGGRVFAAHGSVLAAASPFFHDKLLLHAGPRLALPPAVDASAFEGLLELIYCGRLTVATEALPGHLLVASALQMWHVVERCSQILKELEGDGAGQGHGGALAS